MERERSAFSAFVPCNRVEVLPLQIPRKTYEISPILLSTVACERMYAVAASTASAAAATTPTDNHHRPHLVLPDGRLDVGTHLPLLASRYKYLSTLGEGVSAQVLLAEDTFTHRTIVIKVMRRQHTKVGYKEARTLRYLHSRPYPHRCILPLLDAFTVAGGVFFCLVLDRLYPRFLDWITDSLHTSVEELRKVAYQLLSSVAFLHGHGIVHADIKPDNIMMRSPGAVAGGGGATDSKKSVGVGVVLVDFGSSFSTTESDMTRLITEVQTLSYRAPEVAEARGGITEMIDEWSVGVVLAEAALKRPLFPCAQVHGLVQLHRQLEEMADASAHLMDGSTGGAARVEEILRHHRRNANEESIWSALRRVDVWFADLVMALLRRNPQERMKACEAVTTHPFFAPFLFNAGSAVAVAAAAGQHQKVGGGLDALENDGAAMTTAQKTKKKTKTGTSEMMTMTMTSAQQYNQEKETQCNPPVEESTQSKVTMAPAAVVDHQRSGVGGGITTTLTTTKDRIPTSVKSRSRHTTTRTHGRDDDNDGDDNDNDDKNNSNGHDDGLQQHKKKKTKKPWWMV